MDAEQESIVEINEHALDRECYRQPRLVMDYGLQLAEAKLDYAESKAKVDTVYAQLELNIRSEPEAYDLVKPTEAAIKATIQVHEEYQKIVKRNFRDKFRVDQLTAIMQALEHRKSALESAIKLHGQNYFSQPRLTDEDSRETMNEMNKKTVRSRSKKSVK